MGDPSNHDIEARSYADPEEAIKALISCLDEKPLSDDILKRAILKMGLVEEIAVEPRPASKTSQGAIIEPIRYVIRNDQIVTLRSFLETLKGVAGIVVGILSVQTPGSVLQGTKGIIDGVVALYDCVQAAIARGERLSPDDFLVVTTLKSLGSATALEIAGALEAATGAPTIGPDQVAQILSKYLETSENETGFTKVEDDIWRLVKL